MTLGFPPHKLAEIRSLVDDALSKKSLTKRHLQVIVEKLTWASNVLPGSRTFLRRMIDAIVKLNYPAHKTRLSADIKADLLFWQQILPSATNSLSIIDDRHALSVCVQASSSGFTAVTAANDWRTYSAGHDD